ncbi:ATP-binding protein [Paraherbaspirillum soli]|uniref:histidine kinase n=1 Tax=Paraherbaspirillum soli TaxID=631222 RepID=A0ABW0MD28_9BURK
MFCGPRFMRLVYAIALTAIATIGYLWLSVGYQAASEYQRGIKATQNNHEILVRSFANRLVRSIDERDRLLKLVRADYVMSSDKIDLQHYARIYGDLYDELTIVDVDGKVVVSTTTASNSDRGRRELYLLHRDNLGDSVQIGRPRKLPGTEQWVMHITRPVFSAVGEFAGMVELGFTVDQFSAIYRNAYMGQIGERTSVDSDGIAAELAPVKDRMILRRIDDAVMQSGDLDLTQGAMESRLWLSRRLDPYPILLSLTLTDHDAPFIQQTSWLGRYMLYACIPTVLILLLLYFIYRTLKRQYVVVRKYDAMRRRANDSNKRKSRFLATVVHELRTPLSGIHGYSELVRDTSTDQQSREFADLIHQSAAYLHGLLNTLFDLARIEAGRVVIVYESIETVAFFNYIGSMHQITAQKKQLTFRMTLADDLPKHFFCDRVRLSQILNNLLDNAVKFTVTGSVTMDVALVKGQIVVRVIDTGPGMQKEELTHLFEYFYQSESVRARQGRGLGLGLSLAKEFTDLIRGRIQVNSEVGVGTAVDLRVPLDVR